MISQILDTITNVGNTYLNGEHMEVYSETKSSYDTSNGELLVSLDSFLRHSDPAFHNQRFKANWLPKKEMLREHASMHEAGDMSRDIASSWRKRVSRCIPNPPLSQNI